MIEKLKILSKEEVLQRLKLSSEGSTLAQIFGGVIEPQLPTDLDMMNKINELVEHINELEGEK